MAKLTRPLTISNNEGTIDELVVKGDLSGELTYQGKTVIIDSVDEIIGLEKTVGGARGPVWRDVHLKVVA